MKCNFSPLPCRVLTAYVMVGLIAGLPALSQQGAVHKNPESLKDMIAVQSIQKDGVDDPSVRQGFEQDFDNASMLMRHHLLEKLTGHPRLDEARANVCSAGFQIRLHKAAYFPKLSMSLSAGDKLLDKTTRADEYGGYNSPEYDGAGLNATLQLRQQIYDWGDTEAGIDLAKLKRHLALLERFIILDEQAAAILRPALEYQAQEEVLDHYMKSTAELEWTLKSIEARFEAGAGTLVELRQAQILKLEHEAAIDSAKRRRAQSTEVLKKQFELAPKETLEIVKIFVGNRPLVPETIPAEVSLQGRIISLDLQATDFENNRLEAQRLPKIEGVLMGRAWDINESNQCGDVLIATEVHFKL